MVVASIGRASEMLATCGSYPPNAPNPPKALRHSHFHAGGFRPARLPIRPR
jgi:hypothetical protein